MAGYGAYGNILGKTKMDDAEQQYYQPLAKKTKVEFMDGSWQQPVEGYSEYSSYYNMYSDQSQQQQQSQQMQQQVQQQQQVPQQQQQPVQQQLQPQTLPQQTMTTASYVQGSYDTSQYDYGAYGSYYEQQQTTVTPTPTATYECPLYDKSNNSGYYGNSQQQQLQQHSNNFNTNMNRAVNSGYNHNQNRGGQNAGGQSSRGAPSRGRGQASSNVRGNRGSSFMSGNRGGSSMGSNRGGSSMAGNRGGSSMGSNRGGGNMGSIRGASNMNRGGNRGFYDDNSNGRGGDQRGRFAGMNRGASRGGVGSATRGSGNVTRGRGRGRGGSNDGSNGGKWETLPGGKTRVVEKKPQPAHKTEVIDPSKLPLSEKIRRLSVFLRSEKREVNEIMLFENSLMSCKLGIRPDFMIDDTVQGKNGSFFTGRLILDGIFLARIIGNNKKQIKLACFKKAVEMCRTQPVPEIMKQKDMTPEVLKEKLENLKSTAAKIEKETLEELPTVDILKKLQDVLTNPKYTPTNAISNMELAASVSKCRIRCRFDVDSEQSPSGKPFYKGLYFIDNILQGVGVSLSKKTSKSNCFNMVVQRLTTCKAEDILSGIDPAVLEKAVTDLKDSIKPTPKPFKAVDLRDKFLKMKELLQASDFTPNVIAAMDSMFNEVKLTPVCLYRVKKEEAHEPVLFCNIYLAGRLIVIGEAANRKDAQVSAYNKSKDVLISSEPEFIITQHVKLQPHDQAAPDVIDFRVKGNCVLKNNCTNFYRLQRTKLKVSTTAAKDLVIYEHASWSTDRKVQGFCILQHSCFLNNMLLEWEFCDDDTKFFRCEMKIQKEDVKIQDAKSISKIGSRNLAAADILFKLYETHPVIQITTYTKLDPASKMISFDDIKTEAAEIELLAKDEGETTEDVEMSQEETTTKTESTDVEDSKSAADDDVEMKEDDKKTKPKFRKKPLFNHEDRFVIQAVKKKLEEFTKQRTLDDLLFGPAYPHQITRQINSVLRNSEVPVRFMTRAIKNEMYTIVTQSMAPLEMAAFLKANGGCSGRFRLVDRTELPKHKDIEPELASGEIKISKIKPNSDNFFDDVSLESNSEFHTAMSSTLEDNSAYTSTCDTTMKSENTSLVTPTKEAPDSLPSTPLQGNTSTPKQSMTSTPVRGNTSFKKPNFK